MKVKEDCSDPCPWFEAEVQIRDDQPEGFAEWAEQIEQCKYHILLPDGSETHAKLFIDLNKRFDNNEFTRYLLNRYIEIYGEDI